MRLFFFILLIFTTASYANINSIQQIEIKEHELIVTFYKSINKNKIKKFILFSPHREVFDFKNSQLKYKYIAKKNLKNIRIAQYKKDIVRIVIENINKKLQSYVPQNKNNEFHIILTNSNIKKNITYKKPNTIHDIFATLNVSNRNKRNIPKRKKPTCIVQESLPKIIDYKKNKHELVVIDAGHGGHDSGAIGGGLYEKDLVLSIAKKVSKELKRKGFNVYLTRKTDRFLKLSQRTKIADRKKALAFVSIHANSVPKSKRNIAHGIETFFLQTTRDAKSQRIATRENAAVLKGAGTNLSKKVIVDSVLNGPKIIESNKLAIAVQRGIISHVRKVYRGVKDGGVRHAPFYVLVGASRPSILVEVGYISNPKERRKLFTPQYQNLIAKGIAEGVNNYLNIRKKEIDID